jgi:pyruvate/2-oxoacid:ferredoxin oxidoreductase alpha subunit
MPDRLDRNASRMEMKRVLLSGNHAVAWGARLSRPKVIPVYPITPQTPILELLTEFQAKGELEAEMLTPESEHSVMAACIPASLTGVRVFTATASQGLMLMHEMLHYASGARAPIVMANVNRTVASPWAFWPDQTDSIAQRDTGWIQLYVESAQEALDTTVQAFRIAERVSLPVMLNLDAFYVSHALEPVIVPEQSAVDGFLPDYAPEHFIDPARGESWGNVVTQDMYYRHRQAISAAMAQVPDLASQVDQEWGRITGRSWGVLERYRCEDADVVIVTMGSMCGTVREAVVLDRNVSLGAGGVLHQELRSALYDIQTGPRVHGFLAGVGGMNVPPSLIVELVQRSRTAVPTAESAWAH